MIAVIIPCYKVKQQILRVIEKIGHNVDKIYIVDDFCPEHSGQFVAENVSDPRIKIIYHEKNQGVGGAMITGYKKALEDKCTIAVKIDGDDQMDPSLISKFITPLIEGRADYTKGNRFYYLEGLSQMPFLRLVGNAGLSFINKISSGYWDIMDPTNGLTAINLNVVNILPLDKISKRYFFESDMLFRLNISKAVIIDIPMHSKYADEKSNLNISQVLVTFPPKYIVRFSKRIFYNYFLRDFNIGSITLIFSILSISFGTFFGALLSCLQPIPCKIHLYHS